MLAKGRRRNQQPSIIDGSTGEYRRTAGVKIKYFLVKFYPAVNWHVVNPIFTETLLIEVTPLIGARSAQLDAASSLGRCGLEANRGPLSAHDQAVFLVALLLFFVIVIALVVRLDIGARGLTLPRVPRHPHERALAHTVSHCTWFVRVACKLAVIWLACGVFQRPARVFRGLAQPRRVPTFTTLEFSGTVCPNSAPSLWPPCVRTSVPLSNDG